MSDHATAPSPLRARVGAKFAYGTTGVHQALLSFAVARTHEIVHEEVLVHSGGRQVEPVELVGSHGARLHLLEEVGDGWLEVTYSAVVDLRGGFEAPPSHLNHRESESHLDQRVSESHLDQRVSESHLDQRVSDEREAAHDRWVFTRPSRYAESDRLAPMAAQLFPTQTGTERVLAVTEWVNAHMAYISGSSRGTDGAVDSILQAQGVCRDFAHVVVALLRALGTPARLVSVYAPGLRPMDFHAVAEVWVEGGWHIVDSTHLAPRAAMVRIATGRDAADTAFLTTQGGRTTFNRQAVTAEIIEGELPQEDVSRLVRLP